MVCRRPGIVSSDIKRQTHGFAESPFVIFENLRARKMSHDFLVRGSGRASFAHYAFRSGTSNRMSHHRAHSKTRTLSAAVVLLETLAQCIHCRTSAAEHGESALRVKHEAAGQVQLDI